MLDFEEMDQTHVAVVGGKGAHLAELSRIEGIRVPSGFCVTTAAFQRIMAQAPSIDDRLDRLSRLEPDDREAIRALGAELRRTLEEITIPDELAAAIMCSLARLGEQAAYAVRSSATAEDLPTASFAGQQDTYLNVLGPAAILQHVSRCWASLFTERAITYRLWNGFDHRDVQMAVVVQQMVFPQAAGILFTADPVTSNRKVASVEAGFGLGESLVSGLVNADVYKLRDGKVVAKAVATKQFAIHAAPAGGTEERAIEPERQTQPALTDAQIVRLAQLGRRIEAHFGHPRTSNGAWSTMGSRSSRAGRSRRCSPSPRPAISEPRLRLRRSSADDDRPHEAPGALVLAADDTAAHGRGRRETLRRRHPGPGFANARRFPGGHGEIRSANRGRAADRDRTRRLHPDVRGRGPRRDAGDRPARHDRDRPGHRRRADRAQPSLHRRPEARHPTKSGSALLDFILADIQELKRILFDPYSLQVIMAGMEATWWLNEQLRGWLGERNAVDTLTQSVPHNVTSEMGLALLDVADVIRPHPDVVAFLQNAEDESFLDELPTLAGGREARDAIQAYLDTYGMRCVGEIDITRPRWSERPTTLVPIILGNIKNFSRAPASGASSRGARRLGRRNRSCWRACGPCRRGSGRPKRPSA